MLTNVLITFRMINTVNNIVNNQQIGVYRKVGLWEE